MAARKNAIREARAASQAFASARKQLIEATALQRDTIAAAANEYSANQLWRRAVAAITT
ncbi:phosphoheptose isomerase [Nitrobacter vulgaris]|nr:phosphoheptose isomerase [Nitrobacter vulgaris]